MSTIFHIFLLNLFDFFAKMIILYIKEWGYMKKNVRLILSVLMLICVIGALIFGVIAITSENLGIANTTTYNLATKDVRVEVVGKYKGPQLNAGYNSTYSDKVENEGDKLENWSLGDIYLSYEEKTMSVTFCFKNLNVSNTLQVSVSDYAFDSEGRIKSYYKIGDTEELVEEDVGRVEIQSPENGIPTFVVEKSVANEEPKEKWIKLTFEAVKFDKDITSLLDNSLTITLES